jgi:hypothetical protein
MRKPIGQRRYRQRLVVIIAIGQQQHAQPPRALRPCDFEPPDQGTRSTASVVIIIAARQLRHQTVTGKRTPVLASGVGYSKRRRRRRQSQLEASRAGFKDTRDEPVIAEPEAGD